VTVLEVTVTSHGLLLTSDEPATRGRTGRLIKAPVRPLGPVREATLTW
jgi:hypothetical protein